MTERAALVTGASTGIGFAIAEMLAGEGYQLTIVSRRPEKLAAAAEKIENDGHPVNAVSANVADESEIRKAVQSHQNRYGRLDVLVNNAGVGFGETVDQLSTSHVDLQLAVNIRSVMLFYRECAQLLKNSGKEHRNTWVINTASIAGKSGQGWISVYSATKHAVVGFTQAMNKELNNDGIKSCAICPGLVHTAMTAWAADSVRPEEMIQPEDIAKAVQMVLSLSPACLIPELIIGRPGSGI